MSGKDLLSQDEIDALLHGVDRSDRDGDTGTPSGALETESVERHAVDQAGKIAGAKPQARDGESAARQIGPGSVMDVPVTLSLEFGRARISIGDLLRLNPGTVVELDRLASEPLDLVVNGTLVARGELVAVNERYAVRVTDVIRGRDRRRKHQRGISE